MRAMEGLEQLPQIDIAVATSEDAAGIQELVRQSVLKTYPNERLGITTDDIKDFYKDEFTAEGLDVLTKSLREPAESVRDFVAKENGVVVGYCRVRENFENPDENLLSRIHVLPDKKHRGVGTQLWEKARTTLNPEKNTALWVVEYNEDAIRTYRKWGFEDTDAPKRDDALKSGAHRISKKMLLKARFAS